MTFFSGKRSCHTNDYHKLPCPCIWPSFLKRDPAGTWRQNNVVSTSMRRQDVASTLIWRSFKAVCLLGRIPYVRWNSTMIEALVWQSIRTKDVDVPLVTALQRMTSLFCLDTPPWSCWWAMFPYHFRCHHQESASVETLVDSHSSQTLFEPPKTLHSRSMVSY